MTSMGKLGQAGKVISTDFCAVVLPAGTHSEIAGKQRGKHVRQTFPEVERILTQLQRARCSLEALLACQYRLTW